MYSSICRRRSNFSLQTMAELEQQVRELREEVSFNKCSIQLQECVCLCVNLIVMSHSSHRCRVIDVGIYLFKRKFVKASLLCDELGNERDSQSARLSQSWCIYEFQ